MINKVLPTYADVVDAAKQVNGVAHRTPVLTSRTVNEISGGQIFFKCENFQRAGTFKFRRVLKDLYFVLAVIWLN